MKGFSGWVGNLSAGLLSGVMALVYSLSCAAIIFHSNLSDFLPYGIYFALISTIITNIAFAYSSSFTAAIQTPSPIPSVILATVIIAVFQVNKAYGAVNIALTIVYASLLTGIASLLLGKFKQGNLIRYIPFPVIGGFVTGIGWGLLLAGASIIFGQLKSFDQLLVTKNIIQYVPAVLLGIILFIFTKKIKHFLVMPIILLIAFIITHLCVFTASHFISIDKQFIFFKTFKETNPLNIISNFNFHQIAWLRIFEQSPMILVMAVIIIILTLLNFSSLEIQFNREVNMNKELRLTGYMNIISSLFAGFPVYVSVSTTTVNMKAGASTNVSTIIAGLICLLGLLLGSIWLPWIPKFLISGFLFFLGIGFFYEWLYQGFFRFSFKDYLIILAILIVGAVWNFLLAFLVGVLLAGMFFVLEYRKINSIKYALRGNEFQSNVKRSQSQQTVLREHGEEIIIIKLQGFLFFGTSFNLFSNMRALFQSEKKIKFVLFDFSSVNEIDVSSVYSFLRMKQIAKENEVILIFTSLRETLLEKLKNYEVIQKNDSTIKCFYDLDYGVEWWENQLLTGAGIESDEDIFTQQIETLFPNDKEQAKFLTYLEKDSVKQGDYLFHEGDPANYMIFIESGEVCVYAKDNQRLRTMKAGAILGEIGFYLDLPRVADVKAITDCDYYRLSKSSFDAMQKQDPDLALRFQENVIKNLSEIVSHSNRAVQILSR